MLQFVDFSTQDNDQYLIVDEDALYKWEVENTLLKPWLWFTKRDEYKFKLEFSEDYKITSIAVYRGGECLLCEEVVEVRYL